MLHFTPIFVLISTTIQKKKSKIIHFQNYCIKQKKDFCTVIHYPKTHFLLPPLEIIGKGTFISGTSTVTFCFG